MRRSQLIAAPVLLVISLLYSPLIAQQADAKTWGQNSPGVELGTHESPRQQTSNGTVLMYNIVGKGFPSGIPYTLWGWIPGRQPQKVWEGVSFDKRGVLVCSGKPGFCKGSGADDPVNIKTTATLGEPKRFGVISPDGKIAGFAEAVPFPIEASDKGCKLTVVRATPLAEVVLARATGFAPYEMLRVTTSAGAMASPSASREGEWQATIANAVPEKQSGQASIKVSGKGCSVAVSFDWGAGSNKAQ